MAITADWSTLTFSIPQADITFVSGTLYELDTESDFRQVVNAIMASEEGIVFEDPISHNTEVAVAGTTYARFIEVINGYSVEFTPDSQWSVRLAGSNNNLFDVENGILVQNQVQVIGQNAAGLIVSETTSGLTSTESDTLTRIDEYLEGGREIDYTGSDGLGWQRVQRDLAGAIIRRYNLFDEDDNRITGTVDDFIIARKMIARETPV